VSVGSTDDSRASAESSCRASTSTSGATPGSVTASTNGAGVCVTGSPNATTCLARRMAAAFSATVVAPASTSTTVSNGIDSTIDGTS
jgi:hypothetical protein